MFYMLRLIIFIVFLQYLTVAAFAEEFIAMQNYQPIEVPSEVEVKVSHNTYLVSNIAVSGTAESDAQAFDNGLYQAKFIAFRALKNVLHDSLLAENNETIDSAMVGFVPNGGSFEDSNYVSNFNILFDKDKIASLINENRMLGERKARSGNQSIVARIAVKNDIANWVKVRNRLDSASMQYSVIGLNLDEVEILFKNINVDKLTEDLKTANLDIVPNRDFYFIKVPLFS